MSRIFVGILVVISLISCSSGGSDDGDGGIESASPSFGEVIYAGTSDTGGVVNIDFNVPSGATGLLLEASHASGFLKLTALEQNGQPIVSDLNVYFPDAARAVETELILQLPVSGQELSAGTYTARFSVNASQNGQPLSGVEVTASVKTKADSNLSSGTVRVNISYIGAVSDSEVTKEAFDNAIETANLILGRAGIALDVAEFAFAGPEILPNPREGSSLYQSIAEATRPNSINIVVGSDLTGIESTKFRYGIPGTVPGFADPNMRGVGAVSVLEMTGADGRFNFRDGPGATEEVDDEVRLAGEELAQLIGHFLGLSHTVEVSGNRVTGSDTISDTVSCITEVDCRKEEDARHNFMYPYPLREQGEFRFYKRDQVTAGQASVMQRSILVD